MSARLRIVVSVAVLSCLASATGAAAQAHRPNIVWLVLDAASPALGSYGDQQAITPNMNRIAREGARFTRAFTHTPVCFKEDARAHARRARQMDRADGDLGEVPEEELERRGIPGHHGGP